MNGVTTGANTPRMRWLMVSRKPMNLAERETSNPAMDGFAVANIPILNSSFFLLLALSALFPSHRKKFRLGFRLTNADSARKVSVITARIISV
jgi:hypothetical protein